MSQKLDHLILNANRVGIVSHDSGGANILNALSKKFKDIDFYIHLKGPAESIFDSKNTKRIKNEAEFFDKIDLVLFGTGSTSYEKKLLRRSKVVNVTSIAILDHFVNYRERFIYEENVCFPDYCFVCDEYSYKLAIKELAPFKDINLCENYLISHMCLEMEAAEDPEINTVLYVLENIIEQWDVNLLPWEVAFKNFYDNFFKLNNFQKIIVRPHPKDNPLIYQSLKNYKGVTFDQSTSLTESLSKVTTVVGVESYLLYLAHHCGLNVYTSLPSKIRSPSLPSYIYKRFER